MADTVEKPMSTIIFISTSAEDQVKSCETLNNACNADERCQHRIFFRPVMPNIFQWVSGTVEDGKIVLGCREIIYLPANRRTEIARLEMTKNVIVKKNSMCFVGDKKKKKLDNLINWLLEETEEIKL